MRGFVYVISNPCMPVLLKVGFTTRALAQRMSELQGSGVPQPFAVEFFAEVDDPALLEARAHIRLTKCRHGKEFFRCSVAKAVEAVKLSIPETATHLFATGGRGKASYLTVEETERLRLAAENERVRLGAAKREAEARLAAERAENARVWVEVDALAAVAAPVAALLPAPKQNGHGTALKTAALLTAGYAAVVAFPPVLLPIMMADSFFSGEKATRRRHWRLAEALSDADRGHLRAFVEVLSRLEREKRLDVAVARYAASRWTICPAFTTGPVRRPDENRYDERVTLSPHLLALLSGLGMTAPEVGPLKLDLRAARALRAEARASLASRKAA